MTQEVVKKLHNIRDSGLTELVSAKNSDDAEQFRAQYLGRKGALNKIFKQCADFSESDKKQVGELANAIKKELTDQLKMKASKFKSTEGRASFDPTIPGAHRDLGSLHPITQFITKITDIFVSMGFEIVEDREVETTEYNFDKLNIPGDHPARDMWDTFYIQSHIQNSASQIPELILRTHTSPVQLRAMETRKPPVRLIVPGRCYRHEATDASHETGFYQLEGLVIDKGVSAAQMIYTLDVVLKSLFGEKTNIRIRPSFFPFVEPGHEVDMSCMMCEQKGCSVCGGDGWIEMMGSGMVHPTVLKNMNITDLSYTGFAFGMGIDRLMMLYYQVNDIRLSYSGDLRFLKQF
jgi:phenylalanyl-tRNA synthetase alpha chain